MITTVLLFLGILSLLVFVHEFGHFFVAKRMGIKVEEFGFGLPPRIFGVKRGETIYSINLLPLGGFVKLLGEDDTETVSEGERKQAFFAKSKKARVVVLVSGVLMNFLLAVFCFSFVYSRMGIPEETSRVKVLAVAPSSPAAKAGLARGDIIISADDEKITSTQDFLEKTKKRLGETFSLEVAREKDNPCHDYKPDEVKPRQSEEKVLGAWPGLKISCHGENMLLKLTPRREPPEGEGPLGVVVSQVEIKFYPLPKQLVKGVVFGFKEAFAWLSLVFFALLEMIKNLLVLGRVPKDVAGPVGIFQITGEVGKGGVLPILQFIGVLSVNLAVINVLPFPALDGGRLLFVGVEAVTRRKVKASLERLAHMVGMTILLFLILMITINDIARIIETSGFASKVKSFLPF